MACKFTCAQRGRLGALRRYALYGNPGTPEGRSKGGRNSSVSLKKPIKEPPDSRDLANFIGIMLGDGGIRSKYQFTVSFNYKTDRQFSRYVASLIKKLFGIGSFVARRKEGLGADLVISSTRAVDFLLKHGLVAGNKIKQQIDLPGWIKGDLEYRKACIRGLFDTDGSLYCHKYKARDRWYEYLKLDFTSCAGPLLKSVFDILTELGIKSSLNGVHITISARAEVNKFLAVIGTSNNKFVDRWKRF